MFCSECGKTIDDEALICPECGAITKIGIIKLQDAAKQGEKIKDNQDFTQIKPKDNTKTLRLVAMILGLAGSAALLSSLLGEFGSATVPIIGKYAVSVSSYLDKPIGQEICAIGEVGLTGEVRSVSNLPQRLSELQRLGFTRAVIPRHGTAGLIAPDGLELIRVRTVREAMEAVF